jgi:iron complex outermembrane receptor protein
MRHLASTGVFIFTLLIAGAALAEPPAAPADFSERVLESRPDIGGVADEVDAGAAQAARAADGETVPGVSKTEIRRIEEIVVSARKRSELLEDTPLSVTALGEDLLRETGTTRLDEIKNLVPNLQIVTGRGGQDTMARIRGVGTASGEIAFDPGVGIYVDGVFLPRSLGSLVQVLDVAQIEVLRGPQGTLFGKNTIGGAINITTVKPHDEAEGFVLVRVGNFGRIDTQGILNLPIDIGWFEDKLFSRLMVGSTNDSGYTHNREMDVDWSNRGNVSFLGSLRFLPTESLTIDVSGTYGKTHTRPKGGECKFAQQTTVLGLYPGYEEACAESGPYEFSANTPSFFDIASYGTWGTVAWDAGDLGPLTDVTVQSITSWRQQIPSVRQDLDMSALPVLSFTLTDGGQDGWDIGFQEQISQEIQVNAQALDERLTFVGGAFGFWEKGDMPFVTYSQPTYAPTATAINVGSRSVTDNWNWALYGQATFDPTEWLSLTGGLRYTQEKKGATQQAVDRASPGPEEVFAGRVVYDAWTPMASIALSLPDEFLDNTAINHVLGYFTFSRGFKGGGFNAIVNIDVTELEPFAPEYLDSFEVGVKTVAFDRRLTANLAAFVGNYTDIQVTSMRVDVDPDDPSIIEVHRLTQNAASATTSGIEFDIFAMPLNGLSIMASIGLLDARYDSFPDAISELDNTQTVDRAGERFFAVPQMQTHIGIQYSFPLDPGGPEWMQGWVTPRIDWSYTSAIQFAGRELPFAEQGGVNLLGARLSYSFMDNDAQVALWAQNLLDEEYFGAINSWANLFGTVVRYYDPPRTFGAELSYSF